MAQRLKGSDAGKREEMIKDFRITAIVTGIVGVLFFAGAVPVFMFSWDPKSGLLPLGGGVIFLAAALVFWWMGRTP
jgi:hypothetical protein